MIYGANTSISTYRLTDALELSSYSVSATISGVQAYIESPAPEILAVIGDQAGIEVFECHVEPGDYRITDKVVDAAGEVYFIVGIERHENNEDTDDLYVLKLNRKTDQYNTP